MISVSRNVNIFYKRAFRYENDDEKSKAKRSFFQKFRFLKMVVFIKSSFH